MNEDHTRRLARLKRLAWLMDDSIEVPVIKRRIGVDSLIGMVPLAGDLVGAGVAAYVLFSGMRMGASLPTLLRMAFNVALETVVGAVPLLGDLFDMAFKANQRNVRLLERYAGDAQAVDRRSMGLMIGAIVAVMAVLLAGAVLAIAVTVWTVRWLLGLF